MVASLPHGLVNSKRVVFLLLICKSSLYILDTNPYQSWVFFGRNDAEAETPELWPPHAKSWLIGKDSDAGRDWGQEEKGTTVDEMAGWHHQLDGREFEWTLGDGDGQGGLACCNSWGRREWDMTEWLNWTELKLKKASQSSRKTFRLYGISKNKLESSPGGYNLSLRDPPGDGKFGVG